MAKASMKETSLEENKLKNENDRLKQRQMLKEDEIKDLREKKLKLELEIKETKQREQMVSWSQKVEFEKYSSFIVDLWKNKDLFMKILILSLCQHIFYLL